MISFHPLLKSSGWHLLCLSVLLFGVSAPALAETDLYFIYPDSWCRAADPQPLPFTLPQLGVDHIVAVDGPGHGRIYWSPDPDLGGYYMPFCDRLTVLGFDSFQVTSAGGELIHGTILLGNGLPEQIRAEENVTGGTLGHDWTMEAPGSGLKIVEWAGNGALEGSHGFRVASGQMQDAYLTFRFSGGLNTLQPPETEGGGNNGVETEITLRPPTVPPPGSGYETILESVIYATGRFDGVTPPESLLRMRSRDGQWEIRAEAAAVGTVFGMSQTSERTIATQWCPLASDQANEIVLRRSHGLDGNQDFLSLAVASSSGGDCWQIEEGFISARSQGPEHRFGTMDVLGGPSFDFDEISVEALRFEPALSPELLDSFESGQSWSPAWQAVRPQLMTVEAGAAHTGSFGLRAQPEPTSPSYLHRSLSQPVSELACRFSLDAGFSAEDMRGKVRVFTARSGRGREIKLWVQQTLKGGYQLQAINGTQVSPWVSVRSWPTTLDFRWSAGLLDIWLGECEFSESNCRWVQQLGESSPYLMTDFQIGAETTNKPVSGGVTFDNVQCLIPRSELPNS